jgi:low temperature requirement protein LtrA
MATTPGVPRPARVRMAQMHARAVDEEHRVSTPLELLFDLTFVVAVSRAAAELAHGVVSGHAGHSWLVYLMVFFGIWWSWMNFSWFASAYDTDDVPYRLLTLLQMAGVLVYAAGVHETFTSDSFAAATVGYVIMRVAMLFQWARAAHGDPEHARAAWRYVAGVATMQVLWVLRLLLPHDLGFAAFFALAAGELAVPLWAERVRMTPWHPHHIAERYGLFTIIVLGECVLATSVALQVVVDDTGWDARRLLLGGGGLVLLFALWWLYFLKEAGAGLERRRDLGFLWGYGHYAVFAGLAALGAGLEVSVAAVSHHVAASDAGVSLSVAGPVAVFLALVWLLHAPLDVGYRAGALPVGLAVLGVLAIALLGGLGLPLEWVPLLCAVPPAVLVAIRLGPAPLQPAG